MAGGYPGAFLNFNNFELAWERILRGSNAQYKSHFSHLFASYQFGYPTILRDLMERIRHGHYLPSNSTTIYIPKPTRILRPITLITLNDQVVYQAITNFIADKFLASLRPNYDVKTFGAQYAGHSSKFFYRPWEYGYGEFNRAIRSAYKRGNWVLADFDLVSFFDLIDHKTLRAFLERRIKNGEILDLLFNCLEKWTAGNPAKLASGHGIPQGPESSAFLADILLHDLDQASDSKVVYLRYVDDIKLLARDFSPVRRALLKLDLQSKHISLVPQAQKIAVRIITDIEAELKTIPSMVADVAGSSAHVVRGKRKVRRLERFLRRALERRKGELLIKNETHFKYAIFRMPRRKKILQLIRPLFHSRPDLSNALASYISRFENSADAASILHGAIKSDPVFDSTAGHYVLALDVCSPRPMPRTFTRAVSKLISRSEEQSMLLTLPARLFLCKRRGRPASIRMVEGETNPITAGKLINFLVSDPRHAFLRARDLQKAFKKYATSSPDEDLARYCTYLLLSELKIIPAGAGPSGALLIKHLGIAAPARTSLLAGYFKDVFGLTSDLEWNRLLGKQAHSELQRRAVLIRGKWSGNPSVMVTVLDNFNDLMLQRLSRKLGSLRLAFRKAAGKYAIPDYGSWLKHPSVAAALPKATPILISCHNLRLKADIAHATSKKTGKFTRAVTYKEKDRIVRELRAAYREWIGVWRTL